MPTIVRSARRVVGVWVLLWMGPGLSWAQDVSKTYVDSRGKSIVFPLGDASFADEVVSFAVGRPPPRDVRWGDPQTVLGPPDYNPKRVDPRAPADVVLGCGGVLVVRFGDNVLLDVPGPDLYVFEVGPAIEPMRLAISPDGSTWTEVGDIRGGTAEIDISTAAPPGERYRFRGAHRRRGGCRLQPEAVPGARRIRPVVPALAPGTPGPGHCGDRPGCDAARGVQRRRTGAPAQ